MPVEAPHYQEETFVDESLFADLHDYLGASRFAARFYGQSAEENLSWVKKLSVPMGEEVLRVQNGFSVDAQVARYLKISSDMFQKGSSIEEISKLFAEITVQNYEGYNFEFITREPVMLNHLKRQDGRVIAYKYNNTPLEEIPGGSERGGVCTEAIKLLVKELVEAEPNTIFAITSPKGWAGTDENCNELEFPESQTYLYRINEQNSLEAVTVRTDMTVAEHEEFLRLMTDSQFQASDAQDYKERLKHVSGSLVKRTNTNFADVVSKMKQAAGRDVAWTDGGTKRVTFEQMLAKVGNINTLYSVDEMVEKILEKFSSQMLSFGYINSNEDLTKLMKLLGQTALEISFAHRVSTGKINTVKTSYARTAPHSVPPIDYHAEARFVATQPGCMSVATGNASWQMTALGLRKVGNTAELGDYFECPRCNEKIKSGEGTTTCPHCGMTKEEAGNKCA